MSGLAGRPRLRDSNLRRGQRADGGFVTLAAQTMVVVPSVSVRVVIIDAQVLTSYLNSLTPRVDHRSIASKTGHGR